MKGYIHSVETFGSVDGPGIRYIVFMQGCPLRCLYCHNPDSWKLKDGEQVTVKKLVSDILEYKRFVLSGGVTLSGGEPLVQKRFVLKLIKELKKHKIHVAIDTAGSLPIRESKEIIDHADLIILDIKSLDKEQCKELTGMSNKNTLATLIVAKLMERQKVNRFDCFILFQKLCKFFQFVYFKCISRNNNMSYPNWFVCFFAIVKCCKCVFV